MKKALSLILVLALAVSMLCTVAFAEGSKGEVFTPGSKGEVFTPTGAGSKGEVFTPGSKGEVFTPSGAGSKSNMFDVTGSKSSVFGANGSKSELMGTVAISDVESKLDEITVEEMAAALAEAEEAGIDAAKLVVVTQRDFSAETYPVWVQFYGEGTESVTICQFVKYEDTDTWTLAYTGLAGEWEVEFEAAGTYAIAVVAD